MMEFQELYDEIRRMTREAVSDHADQIADNVISNLDIGNVIDLDYLVRQEIENANCTVMCRSCMEEPDVDSVCYSNGDIEVAIDECAECFRREMNSTIQDEYSVYVHSSNDINYDVDRVEVSNEEIHVYLNDDDIEELPDTIWMVKFGEFFVRRYFTERIAVDLWCETETAMQLLQSIRAASSKPDLQPEAVQLKKEL